MYKEDRYINNLLCKIDLDEIEKDELRIQFKDHINQLKNEYIEEGLSNDDALNKAIVDFGNENNILSSYNKIHINIYVWRISLISLISYLFLLFAFLIHVSYVELPWLRFSLINITPFATLIPIFKSILAHGVNINNIMIPIEFIAFIPVGILLPVVSKNFNKFIPNLKAFIAFTIAIQLLKFIFSIGRGNIDFALIHLFGCCIGYILYVLIIKPFFKKIKVIE